MHNVASAIIAMIGMIILGMTSPNLILRDWIYSSAFHGKSKNMINKIIMQTTLWQRINLWYTTNYNYPVSTKRRIIIYWFYWIYVILLEIQIFLIAIGVITNHIIPTAMFLLFSLCRILFSIYHRITTTRKK